MPRASGTSLSAIEVPLLPKSFPHIPLRNVYCLMLGTSLFVIQYPAMPMRIYASNCEETGGIPGASSRSRDKFVIHRQMVVSGLFSNDAARKAPGIKGTRAKTVLADFVMVNRSKKFESVIKSPLIYRWNRYRKTFVWVMSNLPVVRDNQTYRKDLN